jgi:hypothetical protein
MASGFPGVLGECRLDLRIAGRFLGARELLERLELDRVYVG